MIYLILGSLLLVVAAVIMIYNKLVRLRNTVESSWSDIDVQLKKRYDLVPNLVETVKAYAGHEKSIFEQVSDARYKAMHASSLEQKAAAESVLGQAVKGLFAIAEAYPDLKASANFAQLQTQLKELEDNIEYARRYYNAVVRDFNTLTESFPSNLIAVRFGFRRREFFELEAPAAERSPVKVSFS